FLLFGQARAAADGRLGQSSRAPTAVPGRPNSCTAQYQRGLRCRTRGGILLGVTRSAGGRPATVATRRRSQSNS
ncbi:MAG TPA: hypothetical protein VF579_11440, partial [Candidatus Methylomirabilis sp.]